MNLDYDTYYDKVLGGWLGKCAGGILGAPIEGIKAFNKIKLSKRLFEVNYPNDDLDLQLLWLDMVSKKGTTVRENDFGDHWLKHVEFPWNEYGIATRNLKQGLFPPESGLHNNGYFSESMGCPIRSELWGFLNPGDPEKAAFYAGIDASLDHHGFSVDAEKFLSACTAIAFFETDIAQIFKTGQRVIDNQSLMHRLVEDVMKWQAECGYQIAAGKIKSFYGDANFTSAPMNVGFTLLALLDKGTDFHCVMDALHLGHDSDCIAATAGAMVGIISGYNNIPLQWKNLVGNEVLVSKEIVGIDAPQTITDLAAQTCQAGINFIETAGKITRKGKWPDQTTIRKEPCHLITQLKDDKLILRYENLSKGKQKVRLNLRTSDFITSEMETSFEVDGGSTVTTAWATMLPRDAEETLYYTVDIFINNQKAGAVKRGILRYGSWLMVGPFIEDDKSRLTDYHKQYPEHGLSSLPSVQYMNHDKTDTATEHLSSKTVNEIIAAENWNKFPFHVQRIYPSAFSIDLNNFCYGKGERTIYLVSHLELEENKKMWLSIGSSNPFSLKINGKTVHVQRDVERAWPGNSIMLFPFKRGRNMLIIRLNCVVDLNQIEIGFKEFTGKHPHQEQWSLKVPKA